MSSSPRKLELAVLESLERVPPHESAPIPEVQGFSSDEVFNQLVRAIHDRHVGELSSPAMDPREVGGITSLGLARLDFLRSQRMRVRFWRWLKATAVLVIGGAVASILEAKISEWALAIVAWFTP